MVRVQGKVALITGGASGLGKADAIALIREGARVVVTDVDEAAGEALSKEIGCKFLRQDVRSESDWRSVIDQTTAWFGQLDILVNNAGIVIPGDIESATLEQYRLVGAIHGEGTFLGCKFAIEAMKPHGGSIINIASRTAIRGVPGVITYAAAKGAILSMTRTVAAHCRARGYAIRCNAILPGMIATPLLKTVVGEAMAGAGSPEDVANVVVFLASDDSRHMNGAELVLDNGSSVIAGPP